MRKSVAPPGMLTTAEAAERAGVTRGTWSGYVSRGQAPEPDGRDPSGGNPLWREATVDDFIRGRPGRGAGGGRRPRPAGDA
jgi:hypothetical protein